MQESLFTPTKLGDLILKNRIVMAPMTRSRAGADELPNPSMATYYAQRASAGLIISEGTHPSANGRGYCRSPGIYSQPQIDAWQQVTQAVEAEGGSMVLQLMHCGRISSHHNRAEGTEAVAPSAIQAKGQIYTDTHGMADHDVPRALELGEIADVIAEYGQATQSAYQAGFAGVELHATSGYLPAQFLSTGTNKREDRYGGSVENRIRFVVETLQAMAAVDGAGRVGMRICPGNPFNDLDDINPHETFAELLKAINPLNLAYLHVIRMPKGPVDNLALAKEFFDGPLIVNDSYSAAEAASVIDAGEAEAVSFGRHFIANPDLVDRFQEDQALSKFDVSTLYSPGEKGYTDY